jgi:protein SCO1/2
MRLIAHAPSRAIALLVLAAGLLGGSLPALADNPISPRQATTEIGGQFTLVDQNGHTVTDAQFRGKWLLVYFGYTHCPDACPTALTNVADALDKIGPEKRQKVQAIFITVDPERDTPAVMKDYVNAFEGANIIGLTGTAEQIGVAEADYRIQARRYNLPDGEYAMSHAATIDIMDPDGHFVAMAYPDRIGEHLAQLVP